MQRNAENHEALKRAVPQCLEKFFSGGKILPHNMPEFLSKAVTVKVVAGKENEVDLDVNIPLLKHVLFRRGLEMLEQHKHEEGHAAFSALLMLNPNDSLTLYNLACCESLLGNLDQAVNVLNRSVDFGYQNLGHLKKDSDLDNIRAHPGYLSIVQRLVECSHENININNKNEEKVEKVEKEEDVKKEEVIEKVPEESKQEPKREEKPQSEVKKEEAPEEEKPKEGKNENENDAKYQSELKLLADMGFCEKEKNLALLLAESGNLAAVIHHLF
jgi:hypothetical protein